MKNERRQLESVESRLGFSDAKYTCNVNLTWSDHLLAESYLGKRINVR
ncbi:hypothetical protein [Pandoraea anhela]|nr:hypothetical protein [Pandoraea anhela]